MRICIWSAKSMVPGQTAQMQRCAGWHGSILVAKTKHFLHFCHSCPKALTFITFFYFGIDYLQTHTQQPFGQDLQVDQTKLDLDS